MRIIKVPLTIRLEVETVKQLDELAAKAHTTITKVVEGIIYDATKAMVDNGK